MDDIRATAIRELEFLVVDEALALHKAILNLLERLCRFIRGNSMPFGGLVVLFVGDPRQTLPVVKGANDATHCASVLPNCAFWGSQVTQFSLIENIRLRPKQKKKKTPETAEPDELDEPDEPPETAANLQERTEFFEWVLRVGDGNVPTIDKDDCVDNAPKDSIQIPAKYLLDYRTEDPVKDMINFTFQGLDSKYTDDSYFQTRSILTPRNDDAQDINLRVLALIPEEQFEHRAVDVLGDNQDSDMWTPEILHGLEIQGLPAAVIVLKPYAIIMLMRNISIADGLVNGTRLIVLPHRLSKFVLYCKVITGAASGQMVFIPRIFVEPSEANLPFVFKRRQFPVKLCFAMTINKSQGQGFNVVTVYLPRPVFSHGQLFVAASRLANAKGLRFLIIPTQSQGKMSKRSLLANWTRNVVLKEIQGLMAIGAKLHGIFSMRPQARFFVAGIHFTNIALKRKTREIRLLKRTEGDSYKQGAHVIFSCGSRDLTAVILKRTQYPMKKVCEVKKMFGHLITTEGLQNVLPGATDAEEALEYFQGPPLNYLSEKIVKYKGLMALRFALVSDTTGISTNVPVVAAPKRPRFVAQKRPSPLPVPSPAIVPPVSSSAGSIGQSVSSDQTLPPAKRQKTKRRRSGNTAGPPSPRAITPTSSVKRSSITVISDDEGAMPLRKKKSASTLSSSSSGKRSSVIVMSDDEETMPPRKKKAPSIELSSDDEQEEAPPIELSSDDEQGQAPPPEFPPFVYDLSGFVYDTDQIMRENITEQTRVIFLSVEERNLCHAVYQAQAVKQVRSTMTTELIRVLREFIWLNDQVINMYLELITARSRLPSAPLKVVHFNSFFMEKLLGETGGYNFQNVCRWGKGHGNRSGRVWGYDGTDGTEHSRIDLLLIPVHLPVHWITLCVRFKSHTITSYDSEGNPQFALLNHALSYIEMEFRQHNVPFARNDWILTDSGVDCPQQQNGKDCGVFSMFKADYLALGIEKPDYECTCPSTVIRTLYFCTCGSRAAIECFRDRMCLSIIHGKIV